MNAASAPLDRDGLAEGTKGPRGVNLEGLWHEADKLSGAKVRYERGAETGTFPQKVASETTAIQ